MDEKKRSNIKPGIRVQIVQKQDQRSGNLTEGIVKDILTNSATHPHGIKSQTGKRNCRQGSEDAITFF